MCGQTLLFIVIAKCAIGQQSNNPVPQSFALFGHLQFGFWGFWPFGQHTSRSDCTTSIDILVNAAWQCVHKLVGAGHVLMFTAVEIERDVYNK